MSENELTGVSLKAKKRIFYGWIVVIACFWIVAIAYGAFYSFGIFLNPFRETFGATSAAISAAYSMSIWVYMGLGIISGWATDKYGPKITVIIGSIFMASGLLLTSRINTTWQLYMAYGLVGIGMSPSYTAIFATTNRWFSRRKGLALGIVTAGIGAGPLVIAPIASYLNIAYGWRFAYLVLAGTIGLIIPAALLMKRSPADIGEVPDGVKLSGVESPSKQRTGKTVKPQGLSLKEAVHTRAFWQLAIMGSVVGLGSQMLIAHIVAFSQGKGVPPVTAATFVSTISGLSIVGRTVMGLTSDRIGSRWALIICLLSEGIMLVCFTQASSVFIFFLFAAIYGFWYGGHVPQVPALIGETLGTAHIGTVLGAISFFMGLGAGSGPFFAGWVVDVTGSYTWAFISVAFILFLAAVTALTIKRPLPLAEENRRL